MSGLEAVIKIVTPIGMAALSIYAVKRVYLAVVQKHKGKVVSDSVRYLFIIVVLTIVLGTLAHVTGEVLRAYKAPDRIEDRLVKITARDEQLKNVLRDIAGQLDTAYAADEGLVGKITINYEGPASPVLDEICRAHDCQWQILPKGDEPALFVSRRSLSPIK